MELWRGHNNRRPIQTIIAAYLHTTFDITKSVPYELRAWTLEDRTLNDLWNEQWVLIFA